MGWEKSHWANGSLVQLLNLCIVTIQYIQGCILFCLSLSLYICACINILVYLLNSTKVNHDRPKKQSHGRLLSLLHHK